MKTLIIYDSAYGNTAKVADRVARIAAQYGKVREELANEVEGKDFEDVDMLFIGTPTQGGRPTPDLQAVIDDYAYTLSGTVHVAPFDTRLSAKTVGRGLRLLMKIIGFASPKIAGAFRRDSKCIIEPAEGFIVKDAEGPLVKGELDRAAVWAERILRSVKNGSNC